MRYRYFFALLIAASFLISVLAFPSVTAAQEPVENRVGLVIQSAEGQVITLCLTLDSPSVTGRQVLELTGKKLIIDENNAVGVSICKIEDTGCDFPQEPCFCRCQGADCRYWNYLRISKDAPEKGWQYSPLGAAAATVYPGELEGWAWGKTPAVLPPLTFNEICPPTVSTPAPAAAVPSSLTVSKSTAPPPSPAETPQPTAPSVAESGSDSNYAALAAAVLLVLIVAFLTRRRRVG